MVTRKPVPKGNIPPYPISPSTQPRQQARRDDQIEYSSPPSAHSNRSYHATPTEDQNVWNSAEEPSNHDERSEFRNLDSSVNKDEIPNSLKAGFGHNMLQSSLESKRAPLHPSNPYLNHHYDDPESSSQAWNMPPPTNPPPPPPVMNVIPPTPALKKLSLNEGPPAVAASTNPWQSAMDPVSSLSSSKVPALDRSDSGNDAWADTATLPATPQVIPISSTTENMIELQDEIESPAWDEEEPQPILDETPIHDHISEDNKRPIEEIDAWRSTEYQPAPRDEMGASKRAVNDTQLHRDSSWSRSSVIGMQPLENGIIDGDGKDIITAANPRLPPRPTVESEPSSPYEPGPAYPPRPILEEIAPPPQPPRPAYAVSESRSKSSISSVMRQQKKESYEIRSINWYDASAIKNPRVSPILVQNVNGPCPLLALVNALVLSTPADEDTPLVEALRTREQISLLLLLDAVIDELMSNRRSNDQELPDVIDLHYFLLDLHTGMNVNPCFLRAQKRTDHNSFGSQDFSTPGTFEETKETRLYNTFGIPLIHGWLPEYDSTVYSALERSAPTYEEAQNLQFRGEELEAKIMNAEGLSFQEQGVLEDIITIKGFMNDSATQLTHYGIEAISKSLTPGQFAVLFRNNHFSTLYRHPDDHALFSLVTDMGYATHDEIVWESLADISGEQSELFSGDFRVVTGSATLRRGSSQPTMASATEGSGWQTVPSRNTRSRSSRHGSSTIEPNVSSPLRHVESEVPTSPNLEQEDHDLALALQLQDEEDRALEESRLRQRREVELSQQYIASENATPSSPARRSSRSSAATRGVHSAGGTRGGASRPQSTPSTSNQPRPNVETDADAPPPSYEQASTLPAYNPPSGAPHDNSRTTGRRPGPIRGRGGAASMGDIRRNSQQPPPGSSSGGGTNQSGDPKEKDCIVM